MTVNFAVAIISGLDPWSPKGNGQYQDLPGIYVHVSLVLNIKSIHQGNAQVTKNLINVKICNFIFQLPKKMVSLACQATLFATSTKHTCREVL